MLREIGVLCPLTGTLCRHVPVCTGGGAPKGHRPRVGPRVLCVGALTVAGGLGHGRH